MTRTRLTLVPLLGILLIAACAREKTKPEDESPEAAAARATREVLDYKRRQLAFADSVLGNAKSVTDMAKEAGKTFEVGSVILRDSLMKFVNATPQCYRNGRSVDPYLAGTVTFYIHMSVVGSDVIRVQRSDWTSQAGTVADRCLDESATSWKIPMGVQKQGHYLLQVQFKQPIDTTAEASKLQKR